MQIQPQHSSLALRLTNHLSSFNERSSARSLKIGLKRSSSLNQSVGPESGHLSNSPLISNDGQITFIDEEDEFEADELDGEEKKVDVERVNGDSREKVNGEDLGRAVDGKRELERGSGKSAEKLGTHNDGDRKRIGNVEEVEQDRKSNEKVTRGHSKKRDRDKPSGDAKVKFVEGFVDKERREKQNRLSKVIEEQEEVSNDDSGDKKEIPKENGTKGVEKDCNGVDQVRKEKEWRKPDKETAHGELGSDKTATLRNEGSHDTWPKKKQPKITKVPDQLNSLVPVKKELDPTDDLNSENEELFDHKLEFKDDSLLYLHEYLKTYIENNYEMMRALNKKDKYLNRKIKISGNKHNRQHVRSVLPCQCSACCSPHEVNGGKNGSSDGRNGCSDGRNGCSDGRNGCSDGRNNCSDGKNSCSDGRIACSDERNGCSELDHPQGRKKSKGKYVWFEDPETETGEDYADENHLDSEFSANCRACLEEKRNLEVYDSSCPECMEEYRQKCLEQGYLEPTFECAEKTVKNRALKVIYQNKNVPKRSASEIVCKSLKLKYERNHAMRRKLKRHMQCELQESLTPIEYHNNGTKTTKDIAPVEYGRKGRRDSPKRDRGRHRRYSEELLYTAYLDLELRRKFPDLLGANEHIVNRSHSMLVSARSQYRIPQRKSRLRRKNPERTIENGDLEAICNEYDERDHNRKAIEGRQETCPDRRFEKTNGDNEANYRHEEERDRKAIQAAEDYENIINKHIREVMNGDDKRDRKHKLVQEVNGNQRKEHPGSHKVGRSRNNTLRDYSRQSNGNVTVCNGFVEDRNEERQFKEAHKTNGSIIGKDLLHQKTNPLIELLFDKSKAKQDEESETDSCLSTSTVKDCQDSQRKNSHPNGPSQNNQNRSNKTDDRHGNLSTDEDCHDQNNNATAKQPQPRHSRVLDQLFENQKNTIEELRTMCNSGAIRNANHADAKDAKAGGPRTRKIFSFNFKRKVKEPYRLDRPTSLQNLSDIAYTDRTGDLQDDYRRPNSLQRLNEMEPRHNASMFSFPKLTKKVPLVGFLDRPSSLQKLNTNGTSVGNGLCCPGKEAETDTNLVRQRSASLDQFHGRLPDGQLTRNVSFLHSKIDHRKLLAQGLLNGREVKDSRKMLTHSLSNETAGPGDGDRSVKRSRSLIQKILPLRLTRQGRKKLAESGDLDKGQLGHVPESRPSAEDRCKMPLPDLPYDIPDPDYTTDSHEGIYEELDPPSRTSTEVADQRFTSRVPPIPNKTKVGGVKSPESTLIGPPSGGGGVRFQDSTLIGSSSGGESSGASSGYCTKITTPDVDYYTDRSESLVYDVPRSTSTGPSCLTLDPVTDSEHRPNVAPSYINADRGDRPNVAPSYINADRGDRPNVGPSYIPGDRGEEPNMDHEDEEEQDLAVSVRNSRFFLDYIETLEASKMRLLRSSFRVDPDSLESSSCSSDDHNDEDEDNDDDGQANGYSSNDEAQYRTLCPDSLMA
ncbi:hypothetical protein M8J75_014128 [Diaphorina citri]|nr:hypothetical protein M8J75_014128 [Diaphorina citri]